MDVIESVLPSVSEVENLNVLGLPVEHKEVHKHDVINRESEVYSFFVSSINYLKYKIFAVIA